MSQNLVLYRRKKRDADPFPSQEPHAPVVDLSADPETALALLAPDLAEAKENLGHVRAQRTLETYAGEWRRFCAWCQERGLESLPAAPETIATYAAYLGTRRRPRGISVAISAIAWEHRQAREPCQHRHPFVLDQLESLRRRKGTRPKQKAPMVVEALRKAVETCPATLEGHRDRAILLVCFAGAFRRSELVSLDVADLTFEDKGLRILLRKSKVDQEGEGAIKTLPNAEDPALCPVIALRAWLDSAGIVEGAIFRSLDDARESRREENPDDRLSGHAVASIVKARMLAAGFDPKKYSGHSPRAGLVTSSALAGHDVWEIMAQTGHTNVDTLAKYVRQVQAYDRNATKGLL